MRNRAALSLCILAWISAPSAGAWGPQGHRTIGAIADRLLDAHARAVVADLLQDDLNKYDRPSHRATLEAISTWADEIRGTAASHPSWHYDNRPVCGHEPRRAYCPDEQCNTAQLERLSRVVADPHAPRRERNEALKWIVHLVGDIHQPLHAADNDDRGGNDVAVVLAGVRTRGRADLHGVWDRELVQLALGTRGHQRPPPDVAALAGEAESLRRARGQGTPASWASESNRLARRVAYHYVEFACHAVPRHVVVLDAEYQRAAEQVVHDQLLLAGARLAALLNQDL
ncbi:MAG TPA: S1/P1 nuclease [Steroidobacteraceae bacterium]|nr:S1/P1 nuclease [Steroidobacteraceae bacterium]